MVHPFFGDGIVMAETDDSITVFFCDHGYRDPAVDAVRERDLLRPAVGRPAGTPLPDVRNHR